MRSLVILLLLPFQLLAQDITGIWTGTLQSSGSTLPYELVISGSKDKLSGYSLTVFTFDGVENMGVKSIKVRNKNGTILLEDLDLLYHNYSTPPKRHKLLGSLTLSVQGSAMTLSGTFNTRSLDFRSQETYSGTINLQKQSNPTETKLLAKLEDMHLTDALSFLPPKAATKEDPSIAALEKAKPSATEEKAPSIAALTQASTAEAKAQTSTPSDQPAPVIIPEQSLPLVKRREQIAASTTPTRRTAPLSTTNFQNRILGSPVALTTAIAAVEKVIQLQAAEQEIASAPVASLTLPHASEVKPKAEASITQPAAVPVQEPPLTLRNRQEQVVTTAPTKKSAPISGLDRKTAGPTTPAALKAAQGIAPPAADVVKRTTEILSSVPITSDSLILTLYDNGEIDGDTVSVVVNGRVIIAKEGLTARPLRTTIHLNPEMGDSLQVTMYAENLGRIAPNTGLLVVQDGETRHEIRFAGDFQKNSAIILRRKR